MAKQTQTAARKKQERQWQVDNALSTLQRAEQIKKDPRLMAEVKKSAAELSRAVGGTRTPPKKRK